MSIQKVVYVSLNDVQTEKAKIMDISQTCCCCICGKKLDQLKNITNKPYKLVQITTLGNIVSSDQEVEDSQGFFPVGNECVKKLVINFAF